MIRKLSEWLANFATKKFIIPLLIIFVAGQGVLAYSASRISDLAGETVTVLDQQPFHSSQAALRTLEAMGPEGREYYRQTLLIWDFILPVCFALLFTLAWSYVIKTGRRRQWMPLNLVPLAATFVDFGENALILKMIADYPNSSYPGILTGIKTVGILFSGVGGVIALALWLRDKLGLNKVHIIEVIDD